MSINYYKVSNVKRLFSKDKNNKSKKDRNILIDSNIPIKGTLILITTLLLNNIETGLAASIIEISIIYTTIFTFILGTIFYL